MATLLAKYATNEEENLGVTTGITAFAGGGQGSAVALTKKWNEVNTCATEFDSVKLLSGTIGLRQNVYNNTANTLSVYPIAGQSINGVTNMQFNVGAGASMSFECVKAGIWIANGTSL